jgi:hypothetical protein
MKTHSEIGSKYVASLLENYIEYKDISYTDAPICDIQTKNIGDVENNYCIFKYSATTKDGTQTRIELQHDKLYYLNSSNKFLYIIDGSNPSNNLDNGVETFFAVTAIDIDNNEIDNLNINQKLIKGQNVISIVPTDTAEPAILKIKDISVTSDNKLLQFRLMPVLFYIDGSTMTDSSAVAANLGYNFYFKNSASCDELNLQDISTSTSVKQYTDISKDLEFDISNSDTGTYCAAISVIRNDNGLQYMKTYFKTVNILEFSEGSSG